MTSPASLEAAADSSARAAGWSRTLRDMAVLAAGACALMLPALLHMPIASDSAIYNHVWTTQFAQALARGELYPRWLPESFHGYGAPVFYLYPPLAFYLSATLQLLGLGNVHAVAAAFAVTLFASGAAMRAWLRPYARRPLLWALVYMAAPYHLTDVYSRGALAEAGAFVWLPLIAMGLMSGHWRWLAVSYAGLIATHLPSALLASVALIPPLAAARLRSPGAAPAIAAGVVGGLLLSGVYLLPALALQREVAVDLLYLPYYQPQNWALWPPSGRVNPVLVSGLAMTYGAVLLTLAIWRRGSPWSALALACALAGLGLLPIWRLPLLSQVQFPWRLFAIVDLAAVTALATGRPTSAPAIVRALALAAALGLAAPGALQLYTQNLMPFRKPMPTASIAARDDAPEYLPRGADASGVTAAQRRPPLERFGGEPVTTPLRVTRAETVVLRRFYFPCWVVVRDGHPVRTFASGPGRLVSFVGEPGVYELQRRTLPVEWLGAASSLAGIILLCRRSARRRSRPRARR